MKLETISTIAGFFSVVACMGIMYLLMNMFLIAPIPHPTASDSTKQAKRYYHKAKLYWLLNQDNPIYSDSVKKYQDLSRDYLPNLD